MRGLSASDSALVIQSPTWLGLLLVGVGIALTVGVLLRKLQRPWRLGAFLATILCLYAGWHMLNTRTTFEMRGFYVEGMLGEEERVGWLQVSGIDTGAQQLTFHLRNSNEVVVDLSGLTSEETVRVVSFVRARLRR